MMLVSFVRSSRFFFHRCMSSNSSVILERKGDIAVIIINRPLLKNAIDRETASSLAEKIREFDNDKSIKAGVLYGSGGTFCAGADLKAIGNGNYNRLEDDGEAPLGPSRFELSKPLIAAISGYAVAGGLELACLCDLRVMEEDAIVGVFCRRWGVPLIDGGTVRLPRLIGMSRALDLILTGRAVIASEALQIGFANRVVPKGTALAAAEELAKQIISFPYECMLADRKSVYNQHNLSLHDAIRQEFAGSKHIALHKLSDGVNNFLSRK